MWRDFEHHQQVVEDIGGLGDQGRVVLGDGRYGSLHRLLAKLLGRLDRGAVEQPPRMGVLGLAVRLALILAARRPSTSF